MCNTCYKSVCVSFFVFGNFCSRPWQEQHVMMFCTLAAVWGLTWGQWGKRAVLETYSARTAFVIFSLMLSIMSHLQCNHSLATLLSAMRALRVVACSDLTCFVETKWTNDMGHGTWAALCCYNLQPGLQMIWTSKRSEIVHTVSVM